MRFPADMALSNREKGKEIVADDIVNAKSSRNYLTIKQPTTAAEKGIKYREIKNAVLLNINFPQRFCYG